MVWSRKRLALGRNGEQQDSEADFALGRNQESPGNFSSQLKKELETRVK
jgi:hypothetical protein